jgi:hypothetical protein
MDLTGVQPREEWRVAELACERIVDGAGTACLCDGAIINSGR